VIGKRARVLIIAYACVPEAGSERRVGWHWSTVIQKNHDVTVITREKHRKHIESWIASNQNEGPFPEFIYYDLPNPVMRFKKGETGLYIYYTLWNLFAVLKCRRLNRARRWEIAHFLTFGTLLWPQFWFLMNASYIVGPVGGGERIPISLLRTFPLRDQIIILSRRALQKIMFLNPIYVANLFRARKIFVRTVETMEMIPFRYRSKTELLLETAISSEMIPQVPAQANPTLRIVSVGRLIFSKINPLFLQALVVFKGRWRRPFKVTVIGDGPERASLEDLRDRLGLFEVEFLGNQSAPEVYAHLQSSDIYFSTTMKEAGTWAFFEAIGNRLPIVCLKVNGPDLIVGDDCGIKVTPARFVETCDGLADGLFRLASDPALRDALAQRALSYVEESFTWDRVQKVIDATYSELLWRD
jgi:glycosyltransferase involved in cell wall biosynthesis